MRTVLVIFAISAVALLIATNSAFAVVISPLNSSFEDPSVTPPPDNSSVSVDNWDVNDTIPFPPENWYNTWGYSRWGGVSSPYAYRDSAAYGEWILALESSHDYAGYMGVQQDIGTMTEGDKYTFGGTLYGHQDWPATYQIIFYNVDDASTLSLITDIDFPVGMKGNEDDVIAVTMNYTATPSDEGDELRLLLLPRNLGAGTHARTGIDMVSVLTNWAPPAPIPGDANEDGKVDNLDATALAANWQKTGGALWSEGDFNSDGNVDDVDATILATNWQMSSVATVPEPTTLMLLTGILLCLLSTRKRWLAA